MDTHNSTLTSQRIYTFDDALRIWRTPEHDSIAYSDGHALESQLLDALKQCHDLSSNSAELRQLIVDWPSEYHFSPARHNLLRPIDIRPEHRVLELGSGCGAITRYIGETGATVVAVEGSAQRARITAERCRDLPNVSVYCDNLASFTTTDTFDFVTLIGVLEYAQLFISDTDPISCCLKKAKSHLRASGRLILAIENKLGLKYLAGANEDHLGVPFFGIQDLYDSHQPITFGRRELLTKLKDSDFGEVQMFLPFPDYKLPTAIITEAALSQDRLNLPDILSRTEVGQRSGPTRTFDEELARRSIHANGLLADLANSFLLIANAYKGHESTEVPWLAQCYSINRKQQYQTVTTFIDEYDKGIFVKKTLLNHGPSTTVSIQLCHVAESSLLIDGTLLSSELRRMLTKGSSTREDMSNLIRTWLEELRRAAISPFDADRPLNYLVPADFLDCTPFNLVHTPDGALHRIDTEWQLRENIPAYWVIIRGLLYCLIGVNPGPGLSNNLSRKDLITYLLATTAIVLAQDEWDDFCDRESLFQSLCGNSFISPLLFGNMLDQKFSATWPAYLAAAPDHSTHAGTAVAPMKLRNSWQLSQAMQDRAKILAYAAKQMISGRNRIALIKAAAITLRTQGLTGIRQALAANYAHSYAHSYAQWITQDNLTEIDRKTVRLHVQSMEYRPTISIILPVFNVEPVLLDLAIKSVLRQLYPHWELCIADDASSLNGIRDVITSHAYRDSRIRYVFRDSNGHISAASNSAMTLATGEFITFLDHDDELAEHALYMVASRLNNSPNLDMLYSDEDKITRDGHRYDPYFKPDWNPDLLTGQNYVCHLAVYRTTLVRELHGFRSSFDGAQDWDLALRISDHISHRRIAHIPEVLYHWRATDKSTSTGSDAKHYAFDAGRRAVMDHLTRVGLQGDVVDNGHRYLRIRHELKQPPPKVTIIIPTRNGYTLLKRCIDSVCSKTRYSNYDLLVMDNGSDDDKTLRYLQELETEATAKVIRDSQPFNYSALNNRAAAIANGEILCLLNNDIEVISEGWLTEMVALAVRPETGAVGAMLFYPDDTIQHAGTLLGLGGVAGHLYRGATRNTNGYMGRAGLTQNISAVTAACLVVRKAVFLEVGGLNEANLAIAFNDVDFCLRLQENGYRNVWTPFAELYHHESATRGYENTPEKRARFQREAEYMRSRWGNLLNFDRAHNPNLALDISWPTPTSTPRTRKPWR